ncbi:MAG: hypothetical protein WA843_01900 [Candidatus Saccharimonadales bacterium]
MSTKQNINLKVTLERFDGYLRRLRPYSFLFFLVFVILLYAFVLLRISNLSNMQPSSDAVTSQVKAARIPRIDESVVQQLQSLQDNSVSVKTLFDQARSNPFQ